MSPDRKPGAQPPQIIQEQISARAIEALMSNYRDPQLAFLDLVDNAVDNRIEGKPLTVRIRASKDELSIGNYGGEGLDLEGLRSYFTWGYSEKTGNQIGQYGVGGKAAAGFLGRGIEIACSPDGSDTEYKIVDSSWESRPDGVLKQHEVHQQEAARPDGYFRLTISDLKSEINPLTLAAKLGDIYSPLLRDGSIKISVNGKDVTPLEIKYMTEEGFSPQILRVETRFGDWFNLKVGAMAEGQKGVRPGIRCYYRGRLIEDEQFFGHPTPSQFPGSSRLIGEADLDFVPVTPNKSNFIRSGVQWEMASRRIHTVLTPWMEKLATIKSSEQSKIERYERDLARRAKRVLEHVLANNPLINRTDFPGFAQGRLPAQPSTEIPHQVGEPKPPTKPREGRTSPKLSARGETKRWGAMHDIEPVSMGTPDIRAEVIEEGNKKVLKVNTDFPLYVTAKRISADALEVYVAETLIMEIAARSSKGKTVEEYKDLVNELLRDCGQIFKQRVREGRR